MKNVRNQVLAVLLSVVTAASLTVPVLSVSGEETASSFMAETDQISSAAAESGSAGAADGAAVEFPAGADKIPLEAEPVADGAERYAIVIRESEGGTLSFFGEQTDTAEKTFCAGDIVLLLAQPDEGYRTEEVRLVCEDGTETVMTYRAEEDLWEGVFAGGCAEAEAVFVRETGATPDTDAGADPAADAAGQETDTESGQENSSSSVSTQRTGPAEEGAAAESRTEEKEKTDQEEEEKKEKKEEADTAEPAAASRLIVKTEDPSLLDEEAVIGIMDDVYLLQFASKEEAGQALASYEETAQFAAADLTVCAADYGEFPTGDPNAEIVMTEADNPFSETGTAAPIASAKPLIALVDTGVSGTKEAAGRYSVLGDEGYDGNGHGDAMFDTIRGFDPKAEVISIKALDDAGMGTVSSLYAAVRMAIDMQVSVINLSLSAYSTEGNEAVASIIREAAANGITVVGAAGNNGSDAGSYIPANIPEAVIVSACNKQGERLPSGNFGSTVDLYVLAGSSSYAAATLSGIISATGGLPGPDGNAIFAPSGAVAASDYVDGLCYDGMSGNFQTAGVSYVIHNAGGRRLSDLVPGLTYESLRSWLGSHENDNYYLGTPYPERVVNGIPQYILGRSGDCDNRNPNGDCGEIHGNDDYAGVPMMNCTGFVWHALWKASGLSYTDGINRIPAWGGIGAGAWKNFIQNNGLEYMTVKSGGTNEINEMLSTAMWSAKDAEGNRFLEKGDIIWFWVDQIPLGADDLPVNGYFGGLSDKAHVGIYWPKDDGSDDNRWWDSIGICEYLGEGGYFLRNMLHQFTPKTGSVAMTIIKLGRDKEKPVYTKVNVQKTSADGAMTDGNACYSLKGAKYGVFASRAEAEAGSKPVAVIVTDDKGYGESEEVLEAGKEYFIRETEPPANGSFLADPAVSTVKAKKPKEVTKETAVKVSDIPANDPAAIVIEKVPADGTPAQEGKPLAGTQFTVRYYKGAYTKTSELPPPAKTWVIETKRQKDGAYRAFLLPEYKVAGDDFYFLKGNPDPVLPLGTVTIEETKASEGYRLENNYKNGSTSGSGVYLAVIRKNGDAVQLTYGNTAIREDGFTASDAPVSGGVKIQKLDGDMKLEKDGKPYAEGDKSLAGAEFAIISKNDYTVRNTGGEFVRKDGVMQVIRTDAEGAAQTGDHDLPYGTYEIRETKASAGYKVNASWTKTITIKDDGKIVELTGEADACYEPDIKGGVRVQKQDRELGKGEAIGGSSLAGITYRILNSSAHTVKNRDGAIVEPGAVVQEITTGENGIAQTGETDLPYGTYTLQETAADDPELSANDSYLTEGAKDIIFCIREDGVVTALDKNGAEIVFANQVKRNDLSFRKVESGSDRPMGNIPFVIASAATGEKHVVVTDANGLFSSAKYAHSRNTNVNDRLLETYTEETVLKEADLVSRSGCWFGLGQQGTMAEVNDGLPAFPCGEYTITELRCETNEGYDLIRDYPFVIDEDISETGGELRSLNNLKNIPIRPQIRTQALDDKTKDHILCAEEEAGITDLVSAKNLEKGKKYILEATLMDAETGNAVRVPDKDGSRKKITGEAAFTAEKGTMTVPVPVALDARSLAGKTVVVFEQLFLAEEDGSRTPLAEHKEIADEEQTIRIPEIRTTFADAGTGTQTGTTGTEQKVEDTVRYTGLIPGKEYMVTAVVKTTDEKGNPVDLKDGDGNPYTKTVTFTPDQSEGSVKVELTIDSSLLAGKKAVCFEEVSLNGIPVAIHADIEDEDQTIRYPQIRTFAADKATGEHVAAVTENGMFVDTVKYAGLKPGGTYMLRAILMDAGTGEPIRENGKEGTAENVFTAKGESGETVVEIPVNTQAIAGRKTVVFEELFAGGREDPKENPETPDTPVAEHKDLTDEEQQITVPEIRTTLLDDAAESHSAVRGEKVRLTDTVAYTGLLPGKECRLSAVLMTVDEAGAETELKDADGSTYTAEKTFTARAADGEEKVSFTIDTSVLAGEKVVCFETLYRNETKLAVHADIRDEDQTVTVPGIRTNACDAGTGKHIAAEGNTRLIDTISYTNLTPGATYRASAVLMDAGTGKAISSGILKKVTGETEFVPETKDGTVKVSFSVNTEKLAGVTTVVFEELYLVRSGKDLLVAEHKDLTDTDQQVKIPEIRTAASVKGENTCAAGKDTELTDTVSCKNLIAEETYVLQGKLVDKASGQAIRVNNKAITAERTFTAGAAQGTVEMKFHFDSSLLKGKTVVVFEDLYILKEDGKRIKIASHADVNDAAQSVKITAPEVTKAPKKAVTPGPAGSAGTANGVTAAKTGDTSHMLLYVLILAGAVLAGAGLIMVKKKGRPDREKV